MPTLPSIPTISIEIATDSVRVYHASSGQEYSLTIAEFVRLLNPPAKTITAASYTLDRADAGRYVQMNRGTGQTITVPLDSAVSIPLETTFTFEQTGAGALTFAASGGVTLNVNSVFTLVSGGQFSVVQLRKTAQNGWTLFGGLVAA